MSNITGATERLSPTGDSSTGDSSTGEHPTFDLADMANIFEFARSRLLAIRRSLENTTLSSATVLIISKYLMWEGEVFFLPWVTYCEGLSICPPLSCNLRWFIGILGMSSMELLTYRELYDNFMKLPVEPSGAWVTGWVVNTYPMDWWNTAFDAVDYRTFTSRYPGWKQVVQMVADHFEQLPEGRMLITPATLVQARSMPVAQQLATIQAGVTQGRAHIITMLENKVVEARLVAASLMRMETALGEDVRDTIAATELLVKYLKAEQD
ncbi:uncharacterized protein EDB91DRAFT_1252285 [Suillus paluster]|uniref:uncharacterized protein n=1 Tax=Suillus paluster TaxID=48578 RepID=UPI001B87A797|nr:uncharacterized protein EDB91DRAFT_1252285 [Suillus paluster]KAG1731223.1 hypothetical protein EDB91DRAFT_1252285 [Suillus paluster]